MAALFAGTPLIVVPEIEHRLAEMIDDIGAVEIDVFHERAAAIAVKNDMLVFARGPAAFDNDADGIGRADWRVGNIRRDEKRFALPNEMIDDPIAFADPDFDVAFELIKIFLGIDFVEIVPRVRAFNHHDKEVPPVVKIAIAHRRFE